LRSSGQRLLSISQGSFEVKLCRHSTAFVRARKRRQVRFIPWQRKLVLTANPEHAHAAPDL
jgi:hypothetical protein